MKRTVLTAAILLAVAVAAPARTAQHNDTTFVGTDRVDRAVTDTTITAKGKQRVSYWMIVDGKLLKSNRTTHETYKVAKRNGVNVTLKVINGKRVTY